MRWSRRGLALAAASAVVVLVASRPAGAQGQGMAMPDPSQMSGVPLPSGDLANGEITIRVVRGSVANDISGQAVELHGGPEVLTETTDENGRVQFFGVAPGTMVHGVAVVDGVRLESQTFPVPAQGGVRVMLVAPDAAMEARAAEDARLAAEPAVSGMVVLGAQSQFVVELEDDILQVYYLLQIANNARTPVEPAQPIVFNLPPGARGATMLEGSSPLARAEGARLVVNGPFPPGATVVQAAYELPYSQSTVTITQPLPAQLERLSLVVEKVGGVHVESAQLASHGDMPADGKTYLVGNGPAIAAGQPLTFTVTGLPYRATWPRTLALVLVAGILGAGAWAATSVTGNTGATDKRRKALQGRRDRLFADLIRLEEQHRAGQVDDRRYAGRRRELLDQLERIYSDLDEGLAA